MNRVSFRAMGTDVVAIGANVSGVEAWFASAEQTFSRFIDDSELSLLNRSSDRSVFVSDAMAACLADAKEMLRLTDGLVDPAVGGAVIDWGYDSDFQRVADLATLGPVRGLGKWSVDGREVYRESGVRLDLGGIAKGWSCDEAVRQGIADVVSAGGDVRSQLSDMVVDIEDPWGEVAARVMLGSGGLATSSTTRRRWRVADRDVHHIIDPRRMAPATSPIFSATVIASTAVAAEAGAKAVLLRGEHGLAWAEQQDWIDAALVVWHDGNVYATAGLEIAA